MGGGEEHDDDHDAPQVDFDAGDESTDDESDAGDGDAAAVTVSAAAGASGDGADGPPATQQPPSATFDATNLNLNQAILKGLDVVKQHSGSGGNGGMNSAEASTSAVTDAATANTPPSSVASVSGDPTAGGGGSAAVERGVESARESNEGSASASEPASAAQSHLDMDGSRRMIQAALGGGGDGGNHNGRAASPVPPSDNAAKPAAAAAAAVRGYADVAGPSKNTGSGLANGGGNAGGGGGSRALPPDPYKLGVYVPPHQRKRMVEERRRAMEEMEREEKKDDTEDKVGGKDMDGKEEGEEREEDPADQNGGGLLQPTPANMATQRQSWEELRKLINGTINRLNAKTIKPLIHKLFDEGNLIRGRGLLAKTVLRAATTSPSYADVYAALVAVINTKLPEVGELVLTRTILQFQKAYKRRDKAQAVATANFLGQLFNQGMTHELLCLQLLTILLDGDPTDDSVEVAVSYMRVVGKALLEVSPAGVRAVMERFRGLLHDGSIGKRVQYKVEVLMKDRQRHFEDFPSIVPELDLVEADDQIMFELGLDDEDLKKNEVLDVFRFDPSFVQNEATWAKIRREILGEDSDDSSSDDSGDSDTDSSSDSGSGSDDDEESDAEEDQEMVPAASSAANRKKTQVIHDLTESDLVHLRRTIYLTIMSSATFEECTHKLTKVDIPLGRESELINMIIECCSQERTFLRYYGMIAARFCLLHPRWCNAFMEAFGVQYETIHRLETNKLRNVAKLFAHLLHTDSMPWSVLTVIHLNEDETTSSSRIFVKILVQEMAEAMGMAKLRDRFETTDPEHSQWYAGMFPRDVPRNTRYAINFFTSIGLGPLTDGLREHLKNAPKLILAQAQAEAAAKAAAEAEKGDDSSVSSSSSSSTSSGSSSSFSSSSYSSSSYSSDSRSRGRRRGRNRGRSSRRKGGRSRRRRSYSSSSSSSSSPSRSSYSSRSSSASRGKRRGDKRRSRSVSSSRSGNRSASRESRNRRKGGSRSRSRSPERNSKRRRDRSRSKSRSVSRSRSPPGRGGKRRRSYSSSRSPSRSRSPKDRRRDQKRDRSRSRSPSPSSGRDSRGARSHSRGRESRGAKRRRRSSRSRSDSRSRRSRSRSRSPPRGRRRSRS